MAAIQGWLVSNILGIIGLLLSGLMTLIGYKVHQLLDQRDREQQMPRRMATLEKGMEDLEKRFDKDLEQVWKRIDNVESKLFKR